MDIVINLAPWEHFISLPPDQMFWTFLAQFGWLYFAIIFLVGVRDFWLIYIETKWGSENSSNILLAVDIPKGNEQTPKAVENMFTYLAGAHGSQNFFEKWFQGVYQKSFSYEIVSLEGYTQFLIRTPSEFRSLVESSVYSQYPDAEISEVDDYVGNVPQNYPDEDWDIFGGEFLLQNDWALPIKTYPDFEHMIGPAETQFKDPMATFMDMCSSLRQGEQFWFQMIVTPTGFDWVKDAQKKADEILGRKAKAKPGLFIKSLQTVGAAIESVFVAPSEAAPAKDEKRTMMDLSPKEKRQIEGINNKAGKLAFYTKIRVIYVARREVLNKAKAFSGFVGYMKQFGALDMNSFKPDVKKTMTKTVYFRRAPRLNIKKNKLFHNYVNRSPYGRLPFLLNVEELATIWHFPVEANVKAPLVQKAPGRKADAPSSLPIIEDEGAAPLPPDIFSDNRTAGGTASLEVQAAPKDEATPPENLPFV